MNEFLAPITLLKVGLERFFIVGEHFAETGALPEEVRFFAYSASFELGLVFNFGFSFTFGLVPRSASLSRYLVLISCDSVHLLLNDKGLPRPSHRLSRGLSDRFLELGGYSCRLRLYLSTS